MDNFIKAVVEKNEPGTVYEGAVYDHVLILLHESLVSIDVFDSDLLFTEIKPGEIYEFIISAPIPANLQIAREIPKAISTEKWYGQLIDTHWQPTSEHYKTWHKALEITRVSDVDRLCLVETQLGCIYMEYAYIKRKLGKAPELKDVLTWDWANLYLMAIR